MKTNLTSPRYRTAIPLTPTDARFIRLGIIRLSPGQWLVTDKGKTQLVETSAKSIVTRAGIIPAPIQKSIFA